MVLRRIFGPKRDEVTGQCWELHNEELLRILLLIKYYSVHQIEKNEVPGACSAYGGEERFIRGFGGET
jgi:hypothetical protein